MSSSQTAMLISRDTMPVSADPTREINSIFWILLAVAANTMIQPGGTVVRAAPELSFMLRISPVVCIIDTLSLVADLIYRVYRSNWQQAQAELLHVRFGTDHEHDEPSHLHQLQKNTAMRRVLAALALVQAVRLYAFHHCVFAQVIVSAYLISFFLIEALIVRSAPSDQKHAAREFCQRQRSTKINSLTSVSIALACGINFYFLSSTLDAHAGSHDPSLAIWAGPALISTSILLVLVCLVSWAQHHSKSFIGNLVSGLVALLLTILATATLLAEKLETLVDLRFRYIAIFLLFGSVGGGAAVSRATALGFTRSGKRRAERHARIYMEQGAAWLFVLSHILTAVVYLKFSYRFDSTWSPVWTFLLG